MLGALLAVLAVVVIKAELVSQRLLVIGWLLLPTGGFLFNEVGYYDQVIYLLLFGALWLVFRDRPVTACLLITAGVLVHEITVLTVLPVFAMVVLWPVPVAAGYRAAAAAGPAWRLLAGRGVPGGAGRRGQVVRAAAHGQFPVPRRRAGAV